MKIKRRIEETMTRITPLEPPATDVIAWLEQEMAARKLPTLLAHADDGVVWGRLSDGGLLTARDAFRDRAGYEEVAPPLRAATLQQARAFGARAELLLWRDGEGAFRARLIEDDLPPAAPNAQAREHLDEAQLLWGDSAVDHRDGFTLWREGAQGMLHAIPHGEDRQPPLLQVRHYLAADATARIALSRLMDLASNNADAIVTPAKKKEEGEDL